MSRPHAESPPDPAPPPAPPVSPAAPGATPPADADETRARLLRVAGEVFGHVGFRRATVRDICSRAGANVAAINYHFGDKEGLYAEVVHSGVAAGLLKYPIDLGVPEKATPEQRLHGFVRSFLYRTLGRGDHACSGRIMLWEMVEPTPVLESLFRERIRFLYAALESIVRDLLGPAASDARVRMGCASVLGQCAFYRLGETMLSKVQPGATTDLPPQQIEALADHVTFVTAAGLRAYAQTGGRPS